MFLRPVYNLSMLYSVYFMALDASLTLIIDISVFPALIFVLEICGKIKWAYFTQ